MMIGHQINKKKQHKEEERKEISFVVMVTVYENELILIAGSFLGYL